MSQSSSLVHRLLISGVYHRLLEDVPACTVPLGALATTVSLWTMPAWRRILEENARLALGPAASDAACARTARLMLHNMQVFTAEVLQCSMFTRDELAARVVRYSGEQRYYEMRKLRRGVLLASAHMGAFEASLAMLSRFEPRVHVLYHPDPSPRFERARSRLRRSLEIVEHHAADGLAAWAALHDALQANEAVALHADRTMPFQRGTRMRFLDADDTVLPAGPVRLALACGAPIVPTFCFRDSDGLRVELAEPIIHDQQMLRAEEAARHPAQLALLRAMERAIRSCPEQWMAFMRLREQQA